MAGLVVAAGVDVAGVVAGRGDRLHGLGRVVDLMSHLFDLLPALLLIALAVSEPARLVIEFASS